jgi:hypothetical protein
MKDGINGTMARTNLSMNEGCLFVLFCFEVMRSTKLGCFISCSWCLWKAQQGRVHGLGSMMFVLAVQKFLNIE